MRKVNAMQQPGMSGQLSVDPQGNIVRMLDWATYQNGKLVSDSAAPSWRMRLMKRLLTQLHQQWLNLLPSAATNKGQHFEQIAERWLQARGLQPVTRNYRCRGGGSISSCARGDPVFVEVRYRANATHGGAASSVTRRKQHKIVLAARHYFKQHAINGANQACRFDVIAFEGDQPDWIQNAFKEDPMTDPIKENYTEHPDQDSCRRSTAGCHPYGSPDADHLPAQWPQGDGMWQWSFLGIGTAVHFRTGELL